MGRSSLSAAPQKRDAESKLAQGRLSVLDLAKELGKVAEVCCQRGLDGTSFHGSRRRFQTQEFARLKDLPSSHKSRPPSTLRRMNAPRGGRLLNPRRTA